MSWPEINSARDENRHELLLHGKDVSARIGKQGLDPKLFDLEALNYLSITETCLATLPPEMGRLQNLQTLTLYSNGIDKVPVELNRLKKLKVLDLSRNKLEECSVDFTELVQLTALNLSDNLLANVGRIRNPKLAVLDLSNNKLIEFPDVCHSENANLSELKLNNNQIETVSDRIGQLASLKLIHLNSNKIKTVPGELSDCNKLKDVDLKSNPLQDKRLLKMVNQCHTKQVLDYIKQHCPKSNTANDNNNRKDNKRGKKGKIERKDSEEGVEPENVKPVQSILVKRWSDDFNIVILDAVKEVRPHVVCCIVKEVKVTEETLKKFLQLQTKLHDTICEKRNAATIATHDFQQLGPGNLTYTAQSPKLLKIKPLNYEVEMSGAQLFTKLQTEAENLRKEKKRNVYSGIHKYLYLLEGKSKFPCLLNGRQQVISFPPITNANLTKMSTGTTSILVEVTSATSQTICKKVADVLLREMLQLFGEDLVVQQVKNVDLEGNMKSVYPARNDLVFEEKVAFSVQRE